jgi:hypothetical protein
MAELRLRTVLRIKNVPANHPIHELTVQPPWNTLSSIALSTRLVPFQNRSAFNLTSSCDQTPLLGYSSALNRLSSAFTCW